MHCLLKYTQNGNVIDKGEIVESADPCEMAREIIRNDSNIYKVEVYSLDACKTVIAVREVKVLDENMKEIEKNIEAINEQVL